MKRDIDKERAEIDLAIEGKTFCSLLAERVASHGELPSLGWKQGEAWQLLSWKEYKQKVDTLTLGLIKSGVQSGEFAAVLAANRPEHYLVTMASIQAGAVPVSLYFTLSSEQLVYVLNNCEAVMLFAESPAELARLLAIRSQLPNVRRIILLEGDVPEEESHWVFSLDQVEKMGEEHGDLSDEMSRRLEEIGPASLCTLVYTSGTTGPPKGVRITHRNAIWAVESQRRIVPVEEGTSQLSYLPLAHIGERISTHYFQLLTGTCCYFCPDMSKVPDVLPQVKPVIFMAVPRFWEKLFERMQIRMDGLGTEEKRELDHGLELGRQRFRQQQSRAEVPEPLERAWQETEGIRRKVLGFVGLDRVKFSAIGGAAFDLDLIEWYHAMGLPLPEAYGMTELGPIAWNRPGAVRIGTVGPTAPGVTVEIASDGEILVKSGGAAAGYHRDPERTREVFDPPGWVRTGDLGEFDQDGYLRLIGRKKEILITAGGKNIAPVNIEQALREHPLIDNACVIGERRKYLGALIVLNWESVRHWQKKQAIAEDRLGDRVRSEVDQWIEKVNQRLSRVENIRRYRVLENQWTTETNELTPTGKLRRSTIYEIYKDEIEQMYES